MFLKEEEKQSKPKLVSRKSIDSGLFEFQQVKLKSNTLNILNLHENEIVDYS